MHFCVVIRYLRGQLSAADPGDVDRQRGSSGFGATAGAGETNHEKGKRRLKLREKVLRRRLDALQKQRLQARNERKRQGTPVVALVGYTNAGKSALATALMERSKMNSDSEADMSKVTSERKSCDRLFHTLDTTARAFKLVSGMKVVLDDLILCSEFASEKK